MYTTNDPLAYAADYCMVFPKGLPNKVGKGSIIETDDYIIFFREDTPENIKQRFIKDYAEWFAKKRAEHENGIYID